MTGEGRETEILLASSAPGISRHHWGTEFDLFSLNPRNFFPGQRFVDEFSWMQNNGITWGFFQPYTDAPERGGYMEERWHWSYFPIAAALTQFAKRHESSVEARLTAMWTAMESKWGQSRGPYFTYVRANWRAYMFGIADPKK